jgi:hypothetical protein
LSLAQERQDAFDFLFASSFLLLTFASLPRSRLGLVSFRLALIPECVGPCFDVTATGLVWAVFVLSTISLFFLLLEDFLVTAAQLNLFIP